MPRKNPNSRLREVAAASQVSISTASRALSGDPRISAKTRSQVEVAARQLGYRTDLIARSLSMRRTFTIGLIVGDIGNPFFADLARGIEEVLHQANYVYLLANTDGVRARQREMAARLIERRVDGLVVTVPHDPEVLQLGDVPIVVVDRSPVKGVPYVSVDNVAGGRLAAEHLIGAGYRKISILFSDPQETPVIDRLKGFKQGLARAGYELPARFQMLCPTLSYEDSYLGASKLLDAGVDAIFAISDVMAAAALAAVTTRGLRVPGEFGVVGYDDTPMAAWPTLSLTSIAQSTTAIGRESARMILQRISDPDAEVQSVVLPPRLVVRGSTGTRAANRGGLRRRGAGRATSKA